MRFLLVLAVSVLLSASGLCAKSPKTTLVNAIVVDDGGKPVSGAVVYMDEIVGKKFKPPKKHYVMSTVNKEFDPMLLPILVGATVDFPNNDEVHHHLYSFSKPKKFNRPLHKEEEAEPVKFEKTGVVKVGCNIHDWMKGVVLILPTPYFAQTDKMGKATLKVPQGSREDFLVYHRRLKGKSNKTKKSVDLEGPKASVRWEVRLKRARKKTRRKKKIYY